MKTIKQMEINRKRFEFDIHFEQQIGLCIWIGRNAWNDLSIQLDIPFCSMQLRLKDVKFRKAIDNHYKK